MVATNIIVLCYVICYLLIKKKKHESVGSKCGTMRVITATLRNGRVAVAAGGTERGAGRGKLPLVFLLISSSSRVNKNNALGLVLDLVPDAGSRRSIYAVVIASGNGYRLSAKKRGGGEACGSHFESQDSRLPT